MTRYELMQGDVLEWAATYDGEPLFTPLGSLEFRLGCSVAATTESEQVAQVVGFEIGSE